MSQICPQCGNSLKDNVKFCSKCGYKMSQKDNEQKICPHCGSTSKISVKFCNKCGFNFNKKTDNRKNILTVLVVILLILGIWVVPTISLPILIVWGIILILKKQNIWQKTNTAFVVIALSFLFACNICGAFIIPNNTPIQNMKEAINPNSLAKPITIEEYCQKYNEEIVGTDTQTAEQSIIDKERQRGMEDYQWAQYQSATNPYMILNETLEKNSEELSGYDTDKYDVYSYQTKNHVTGITDGTLKIGLVTEKDSDTIVMITAWFHGSDFAIGDKLIKLILPSFGSEPNDYHTMYYELRDTWNSHRYIDGAIIDLVYGPSSTGGSAVSELTIAFKEKNYYEKHWLNNENLYTKENPKDYSELIGTWKSDNSQYGNAESTLIIQNIDKTQLKYSLYIYEKDIVAENITVDISKKTYAEFSPDRTFDICDGQGNQIGTLLIPTQRSGTADTILFETGNDLSSISFYKI